MTSKITISQPKVPLTLGNLREFIEQCERMGIPDDAIIQDVRTTFGGKLTRLAADSENRKLDRSVPTPDADDMGAS